MAYLANNGSNSNSGLNLSKSSGTESSNFGTGQTSKKQVNKLPNAGWANLKDYLSKNTVNPEAMAAKAVSTVKTPTFTIPTAPTSVSSLRPEGMNINDWNPTAEQENEFTTALSNYSTQLAGIPGQFTTDLENSRNTANNLKVGEGESNASYWSRITGNNNTQGENALNNALLSGTKTPDLYGQVSSGLDAAEAGFNSALPSIEQKIKTSTNPINIENQDEYVIRTNQQNKPVLQGALGQFTSEVYTGNGDVNSWANWTDVPALTAYVDNLINTAIKPWMTEEQKTAVRNNYLGWAYGPSKTPPSVQEYPVETLPADYEYYTG